MEYENRGWLTREGQHILKPFHMQGPQPDPNAFRLATAPRRRSDSAMDYLPSSTASHVRIPERPGTSQGFTIPPKGVLKEAVTGPPGSPVDRSGRLYHPSQKAATGAGDPVTGDRKRSHGFASMSVRAFDKDFGPIKPSKARAFAGPEGFGRTVKRLPGWRQYFDIKTHSFYWVNTRSHTSQYHSPDGKAEEQEERWTKLDEKEMARKIFRKGRAEIVVGAADHWLPDYRKTAAESNIQDSMKAKQTLFAMLHRWSLRWDKILDAFKTMDLMAEVTYSQLRSALIRFNVYYADDLLQHVWQQLDPGDGLVKISELTDFVFQNEPTRFTGDASSVSYERMKNTTRQMQTVANRNSQTPEQTQPINAAAEKNQFARSLIFSMENFAQSELFGTANNMNIARLKSLLSRINLMPNNSNLVDELHDFLTELRGGSYTIFDINAENIRAFSRKNAIQMSTAPKKAAIWSPADGGSKADRIALLPPHHRKYIQLIRDKMFGKYPMASKAFRDLDKEKNGVISRSQFLKAIEDMELSVPRESLEFLWTLIDSAGEGQITFSKFVAFFESIVSKEKKLVDTGTRPEGKTEKMGAVRVPIYTGVKCMMSGRIKRVEISKPSEELLSHSGKAKSPIHAPMLIKDKFMHTRTEFLGIYPESKTLQSTVKCYGNATDYGARDIFRAH